VWTREIRASGNTRRQERKQERTWNAQCEHETKRNVCFSLSFLISKWKRQDKVFQLTFRVFNFEWNSKTQHVLFFLQKLHWTRKLASNSRVYESLIEFAMKMNTWAPKHLWADPWVWQLCCNFFLVLIFDIHVHVLFVHYIWEVLQWMWYDMKMCLYKVNKFLY